MESKIANRLCAFLAVLLFFIACNSTHKMLKSHLIPLPQFDKEGHRGCRGLMPENTIASMKKALDLGVTTLEMDISFTKDNMAVLSHEPFFNHEISTKSNGNFITEQEEKQYNIFQMLFEEMQQFDVGLKAHPRFPQQQKIAAQKPALTALIDSVEAYILKQKLPLCFYNIETKTMPETDGIYHPTPELFVDQLMQVIQSKGIENRVIIQSFDMRTLKYLHQKYPSIYTALLIENSDKASLDAQLNTLGFYPTIYSPNDALVNPTLIQACHQKNIKIIPWTVNTKARMLALINMGVDGIISDYPNLF
jgi:glycerophosphoryl diester phosphodiesterase